MFLYQSDKLGKVLLDDVTAPVACAVFLYINKEKQVLLAYIDISQEIFYLLVHGCPAGEKMIGTDQQSPFFCRSEITLVERVDNGTSFSSFDIDEL